MWRRWGDYIYALLVLVVFGAEALALIVLSGSFFARLFGLLSYATFIELMIAVVLLTSIALAVVMMHVLFYVGVSAYRERGRKARAQAWTDLFVAWLFDRSVRIPKRLPREGIDALLELRETISGDDAAALGEQIETLGIADRLIRRARSRRLAVRLHAIEGLAKARAPSALDTAYQLLEDDAPVVRFMATRVIARTLAAFPEREHTRFVAALRKVDLPSGVIEEALLLLDAAAAPVITELLTADNPQPRIVRAALEAAGRTMTADAKGVAAAVTRFIGHENPELNAAAMQCAARMHLHAPALSEPIARAASAPVEFVRLQATRALSVIDEDRALPTLWERLHDTSWWVRHAAAETLHAMGPRGVRELERARAEHPDRFARHMAHHVLMEAELGGAS